MKRNKCRGILLHTYCTFIAFYTLRKKRIHRRTFFFCIEQLDDHRSRAAQSLFYLHGAALLFRRHRELPQFLYLTGVTRCFLLLHRVSVSPFRCLIVSNDRRVISIIRLISDWFQYTTGSFVRPRIPFPRRDRINYPYSLLAAYTVFRWRFDGVRGRITLSDWHAQCRICSSTGTGRGDLKSSFENALCHTQTHALAYCYPKQLYFRTNIFNIHIVLGGPL